MAAGHAKSQKSPLDLLSESDSDLETLAEVSDSESWEESSGADSESDPDTSEPDCDMGDVRIWCPIASGTDQVATPRFPFTGSPEMKVDVEYDNPLAFLKLFLSEEIIEKIVVEDRKSVV